MSGRAAITQAPEAPIGVYPSRALNEGFGNQAWGLEADPPSKTHEANSNAAEARMSRLAQTWRMRLTKTTAALAIGGAGAGLLGACGGVQAEGPRPVPTVPGAEATVGPGKESGGGGSLPERIIIGSPECYAQDYAAFTPAEQERCRQEFTDFTLEQVEQLLPLDQARWALYYRHDVLEPAGFRQPVGSSDQSQQYMNAFYETTDAPEHIARGLLQMRADYALMLAWAQLHPEKEDTYQLAQDPRTWAAMFGPGTTQESAPLQDVAALGEVFADEMTSQSLQDFFAQHEQYGSGLAVFSLQPHNTMRPLYAAEDVSFTSNPDGSYTLSFIGENRVNYDNSDLFSGIDTEFEYTFMRAPRLEQWPEGANDSLITAERDSLQHGASLISLVHPEQPGSY